jgi:hypothetical protein
MVYRLLVQSYRPERLEVLKAMKINIAIIWVVTPLAELFLLFTFAAF